MSITKNIVSGIRGLIILLFALPVILTFSAMKKDCRFTKLEVFGMDWRGHYMVSPKPGHVILPEHKKLSIEKCRKIEDIYNSLKTECSDTVPWKNLSYYCAFSFISAIDTTTYYIGTRLESDTLYAREGNTFFQINQSFIETLRSFFSEKERDKIAGSLPLPPRKIKHPIPADAEIYPEN